MTINVMPVHHMGLLRYAWPSPAALPDLAVELRRPFFLMTKLGVSEGRMRGYAGEGGSGEGLGKDEGWSVGESMLDR